MDRCPLYYEPRKKGGCGHSCQREYDVALYIERGVSAPNTTFVDERFCPKFIKSLPRSIVAHYGVVLMLSADQAVVKATMEKLEEKDG
jgi:hypothetical protein